MADGTDKLAGWIKRALGEVAGRFCVLPRLGAYRYVVAAKWVIMWGSAFSV
jgi:hypothetical protein